MDSGTQQLSYTIRKFPPVRNTLPKSTDEFRVCASSYFTRKYMCGHRGARWFQFSMYGTKTDYLYREKNCPDCYLNKAKNEIIRCGRCGCHISPGDNVALYLKEENVFQNYITEVNNAVIGCMRWRCCPSGVFFAGKWTEYGFRAARKNHRPF